MKHCRFCGKKIDGGMESECARCDKLRGEAFMDVKAELEI